MHAKRAFYCHELQKTGHKRPVFYRTESEKGSFLSRLTAAFVFCLVEGYNHAAAFAQDAALFSRLTMGIKKSVT